MLTALLLVGAFVLVALGGLLAAIDSALSVQSRGDLLQLAQSSRSERSLRAIAADLESSINAINFARILAETSAAVLVTLALVHVTDVWWLVLIVSALIMSALSFVLVGVSPRSVGRARPQLLLRYTAGLVRFIRVMLGPIPGVLISIGNTVTPSRARQAAVTSEDQLLSIVDEATEFDVLEEDDREFIHSIIEFGDKVVREVMVPRTEMTTVGRNVILGDALKLFFETGVSRIPVIDDDPDEVVGILYLRDAAKKTYNSQTNATQMTCGALARAAQFVPESQKTDDLLKQMQRNSNHLAMVVDEYGGIAGLVTLEDLIEELVGEISDEYDRENEQVRALGSGRFRVATRLPVDELGDLFGIAIDDSEVDSVGGLVAKTLGRLPGIGTSVSVHGLRVTVDRMDARKQHVLSVVVERDDDAGVEGEK